MLTFRECMALELMKEESEWLMILLDWQILTNNIDFKAFDWLVWLWVINYGV